MKKKEKEINKNIHENLKKKAIECTYYTHTKTCYKKVSSIVYTLRFPKLILIKISELPLLSMFDYRYLFVQII